MRRMRGLTLIELMVSMTIFSILGLFLFVLMRSSLDIYRTSRGSGELYDKLDQASRPLLDDLSCVSVGDPEGTGPKVQLLATHDRRYVPPEKVTLTAEARKQHDYAPGDPRSFLLRFVRSFPGSEMETTIGRFAGTYEGGTAYIDGVDDFAESRADEIIDRARRERSDAPAAFDEPGLRAPSNLMEVMYFLDSGPEDRPGTYTLYRAARAPIGGAGSFFRDATLAAMTPEWCQAHAKPVVSGITYFGLVFWSQNTEEWETERVLSGDAVGPDRAQGFAELWWDSTRGRHAEFGLHRGKASAANWEDDVFPARARLVIGFVQEGQVEPEALLASATGPKDRVVRVTNPELFADLEDGGPRFLRVDDEWMEVTAVAGRQLTVRRAVRQSAAKQHPGGAPVVVGRTFRKTIEIPAYRTYFRGPGEGGS